MALNTSGATIAPPGEWNVMHELRGAPEPNLFELLAKLSPVDLVMVEGFKRTVLSRSRCTVGRLGSRSSIRTTRPWRQCERCASLIATEHSKPGTGRCGRGRRHGAGARRVGGTIAFVSACTGAESCTGRRVIKPRFRRTFVETYPSAQSSIPSFSDCVCRATKESKWVAWLSEKNPRGAAGFVIFRGP
jgi:hypothetical protein